MFYQARLTKPAPTNSITLEIEGITSMTALTSKGQVTIPKRVRDALGLKPGSKVNFEVETPGRAIVTPASKPHKSEYAKRLEKVRGTLKTSMTTDQIMEFLRGD
jgi:antitoxin PrlF